MILTREDTRASSGTGVGVQFPAVLFGLLVLASLWSNRGPINFSAVDALLLAIGGAYVLAVAHLPNPLFDHLARTVGALMFILTLLGGVMLLLAGGWVTELMKDALSFAYLFVGLAVLLKSHKRVDLRPAFILLYISTVLLSVFVVAEGGVRPSGSMPNPNLTSAWLAGAALVFVITSRPTNFVFRLPLIALSVYAYLQAGSLGATVALVAAVVYLVATRVDRLRPVAPLMAALSFAAGYLALPFVERFTSTAQLDGSRIGRSSEARFAIWNKAWEFWLENPLGSGPGSFNIHWKAKFGGLGADTHNDYLTLLTSVGIVGLVLWLTVLWQLFRISAAAQPLVLFLAVDSLTNGAMNMRSNYIFIALVIAWEYWKRESGSQDLNVYDNEGTIVMVKHGSDAGGERE